MNRLLAVFAASLLGVSSAVPSLPDQYSLILKYETDGIEYINQQAYDLANQKLSDTKIVNNTVISKLIELPTTTGLGYTYTTAQNSCTTTNITGTQITGGILTFPDMVNETVEVVDGVNCDRWSKNLGTYTIKVWFEHDGSKPVQLYNELDKEHIKDGIKKVQCYYSGTSWDAFSIPSQCPQPSSTTTDLDLAALTAQRKQMWLDGALSVPTIPGTCSYKIDWSATIAGQEYSYEHYSYYDLAQQRHRDNQLGAMCSIVATTVELGNITEAYHYDAKTLECTKYPISGKISQYILTYPNMKLMLTEKVNGILCDKWAITFPPSPATPVAFTVAVWFKVNSSMPVQLYNSNDELENITHNGLRHISYYSSTVADTDFQVPYGC